MTAAVEEATRTPALSRRWIAAYPALWLLGLAFLFWPLTLVRVVIRRGARRTVPPWPLLAVVAALAASLLIALMSTPPLGRLLGAALNLAVWLVLLLALTEPGKPGCRDGIAQGLIDVALVQSVLVLLARLLYPAFEGAVLPAARLLPQSLAQQPNVAAFTTVRLAFPDYFGRVVLRTGGLFGTPTWAAMLAAIAVLLVLAGTDHGPARGSAPVWRAGYVVVLLPALVLGYSRNTALALFFGVGVLGFAALRRHGGAVSVHVVAWALLPVLLGVVLYAPLAALARDYNSVRAGSLVSRLEIYRATLGEVREAPVPGLGLGVKQEQQGLVASVGSHSTYLGLTYRGGPAALVGLVWWLLALARRGIRDRSPVSLALVAMTSLWAVGEDLDVGHLAPLALLLAAMPHDACDDS